MYLRFLFVFLLLAFSIAASAQSLHPHCQHHKAQLMDEVNLQAVSANNSRSDTLSVDHYEIHLDISDLSNNEIGGNTVITLSSKIDDLQEIKLDLLSLPVSEVLIDGEAVSFDYSSPLLTITPNEALAAGESHDIDVYYAGDPATASFGGFYTTQNYFYNLGVGIGVDPPTFGRTWFPCVDNFVEKSTYECHIRTAGDHKAFCGGLLTDQNNHADGDVTWVWTLDQRIPTYLASVAVAKYHTLEWEYEGINGTIPVQLGAVAADTANLRSSFINLDKAIEGFETAFGAYPFDRIGFVMVPFNGGAMEHATNVAYPRFGISGGGLNYEDLMAHEFAHHWWGNYMTCETADQMWLNEGWASYCALYFYEIAYGKEEYKTRMRDHHRSVALYAHIRDGAALAVAGVPFDATYGSTVYEKGADVIHTMRSYMGDIKFFLCTKEFLATYAFANANTEQFMNFLTECSGIDMEPYFNGYLFQPGFAHFAIQEVQTEAIDDGFSTTIRIQQKLRLAEDLHEQVPLTISFMDANGDLTTKDIMMSGACMEHSWTLDFEPIYVGLDIEEHINDATIDRYQWIDEDIELNWHSTTSSTVEASNVTGSIFCRIVNNLVHPDRPQSPLSDDFYLSQERFWTVELVPVSGATADINIEFSYNGSTNTSSGYLDTDLFSTTESALRLFYRADANEPWEEAANQEIVTGASVTDRIGRVRVTNPVSGEYALAISDPDREETISNYAGDCESIQHFNTSIEQGPAKDWFSVYPNPAQDHLSIRMQAGKVDQVSLRDTSGRQIHDESVQGSNYHLNTSEFTNGMYVLELRLDGIVQGEQKVVIFRQ